ncbi:unnamed protein product [Echinostoma caproni]|uniref:Sulfhydryl oxidase n=1 Tax=Echinostoma caproni TaxID=27848 RepID=A0A3P8GER2_9TREM|nr:unnamed protein product [Echinostoma caproni]
MSYRSGVLTKGSWYDSEAIPLPRPGQPENNMPTQPMNTFFKFPSVHMLWHICQFFAVDDVLNNNYNNNTIGHLLWLLCLKSYRSDLWSLSNHLFVILPELPAQCNNAHTFYLPGDIVAHTMNRFIPRFFSCQICAFHFAENSANIVRRGESVLWLNAVHNRVNRNLMGSPTEDPSAPKMVYPPRWLCAQCWSRDPQNPTDWVLGGDDDSRAALLSFLVDRFKSTLIVNLIILFDEVNSLITLARDHSAPQNTQTRNTITKPDSNRVCYIFRTCLFSETKSCLPV